MSLTLPTLASLVLPCFFLAASAQETFPPLDDRPAPASYEALWAGFNPRAEPLEVEVLHEWEEEGVLLKILRYRVGVFKGEKALMAAVYGFPKGGGKLPGLVQIHGGGQYADYRAVLSNGKRGYATISIAWAGRINAPDYKVTPKEVQLFWDAATKDRNYKITTDWGALDAYHAPCRNPRNGFAFVRAAPWTLDAVDSPRNNPWFLCTLAARRALTFLERQPEVDGGKLGVYGHSMGGKLTVLTAGSDSRVQAAAPSCGGISNRDGETPLFRATLGDDVYLKHISCPIMFLSPANDFHGRINDLQTAITEIGSQEWRITCAPHHNHQDTAEYEVATQLWFDQHLKGTFQIPKTPRTELQLSTEKGVPVFSVRPNTSMPVLSVEVYYTQQGKLDGGRYDRDNTVSRFWRHAVVSKSNEIWTAELPLFSLEKPLWVYANVLYPLGQPVTGAGYYYGTYTTQRYNLSSAMAIATPDQLKADGVKATLQPSLMIETFAGGWEKEWFSYKPEHWARSTHKVYGPQWAAPPGARLALEVRAEKPNKLVIRLDDSATEIQLSGGTEWREITLTLADFNNAMGESMAGWTDLMELRLSDRETLRANRNGEETRRTLGAVWQGPKPEFRNLRWITAEKDNR